MRIRQVPADCAVVAMLVLMLGLLTLLGCSQTLPPGSPNVMPVGGQNLSPISDEDFKPSEGLDRIGPGDLVEISVTDLASVGVQTTVSTRVSDPGGTIYVPLVPQPIHITGLTEHQASDAIMKAYEDALIMKNAHVTVSRQESQRNRVTVIGDNVDDPGEFRVSSPMFKLTTLLSNCKAHLEGVRWLLLVRCAESKVRRVSIPVPQLLAGDEHFDVVIHPGDLLIVPVANSAAGRVKTVEPSDAQYYIYGDGLGRVGAFPIPRKNITLKQAIIAAGATDEKGFVRLVRSENNIETALMLNKPFSDISSGAIADMNLQPNDIITVSATPLQWHGATTQPSLPK